MIKCPNCGVGLADHLTRCPVCGKFIHDKVADVPESYPAIYARLHPSQLLANLDRGLWLVVLVSVAVNLFINWGEWTREAMWCMYVVATAVILHFCVYRPLRLKVFYWLEAILQIIFGLAYFLFWDWATDGKVTWSVTWLFPIVLAVISLTACIWLSIRRRNPGNLLLLSMSTFISTLVLWLVGRYQLKALVVGYIETPVFAAFLIATGVFVFFAAYRFHAFQVALKRRFHV